MARPLGALSRSTQEVKDIIDKVAKRKFGKQGMEAVFERMMDLVDGVRVQETDRRTGTDTVYRRPPNETAGRLVLNYRYGMPHQAVDITSGGEKIAPVRIIEDLTD